MLKFLFGKSPSTPDAPPKAESFTYHRKSGIRALLFALLMAAAAETVVLHYFLAKWNQWAALIATLSSLWVVLTVVAQIRAIGWRPIFVHDQQLCVRNGMYEILKIPFSAIESVELSGRRPELPKHQAQPMSCCFPASHNVIVSLNRDLEAHLLFGQRRKLRVALVYVDDPQRFQSAFSETCAAQAKSPQQIS